MNEASKKRMNVRKERRIGKDLRCCAADKPARIAVHAAARWNWNVAWKGSLRRNRMAAGSPVAQNGDGIFSQGTN
jgi:hypothetical protein